MKENETDIVIDQAHEKNYTKYLQESGMDNNKVGFYQISFEKDYLTHSHYSNLKQYMQENINRVFLVYDFLDQQRGVLNPFKAFIINKKYLELDQDYISYEVFDKITFKNDKVF